MFHREVVLDTQLRSLIKLVLKINIKMNTMVKTFQINNNLMSQNK